MQESNITRSIITGGSSREKAVKYVFNKHFGYINQVIKKLNLINPEDREKVLEAYTDAVVIFQNQIIKGNFQGKAKYSTYLYSIFYHKCIDIIRNKATNIRKISYDSVDDFHDNAMETTNNIEKKEDLQEVMALLDGLPAKCKNVLMDWNDGYSMNEIADRNDLENEAAARNKKYNCLKGLMKKIKLEKLNT